MPTGLKGTLTYLFLFMAGVNLFAQTNLPDPIKTTNDYYQAALQAYLAGDYDQAILLDSKALQTDTQDQRAQALLNVLISEKDNANKTVIWIGGKPSVIDKVNPPEVPAAPTTIIREIHHSPGSNQNQKVAELESRLQTVAFLMERDSFNSYRELNGNQTQMAKRVEEVAFLVKDLSSNFRISNLLFLLALIMAALALWKSWVNGQDIKKQKDLYGQINKPEEKTKIVRMR